CQQHYSYPPTF
nr:immunoglobulin light chain junction region [Macaca mulatta]MOW43088.1 immunoglobulin light chain junction region [Macaca mulatta]MOW44524.1 immunoglobulin light chain junction region [Macaca mulatta]MOW44954.1 immunoglobulin light chain junction region [Macaca mulatta]MOW44992.1 immunoglobulin light chain junction region [Macaca mulatta]